MTFKIESAAEKVCPRGAGQEDTMPVEDVANAAMDDHKALQRTPLLLRTTFPVHPQP